MTLGDGVGRYHQPMPRNARPVAVALSVALCAALSIGCGRDRDDAPAAARADGGLAPLPEAFQGEWAGVLPCVDCAGLDVQLELQREPGAVGRYRLREAYLGSADDAGFEVAGEWREEPCRGGDTDGACVLLVESGQRWFRQIDGSLQAIDADGRALDPDGARLLRQ